MAVWLIADPLNARLRNENDMRKNDSVIRPQGGEVRRGHRGRTHVDAYGRLVAAHYGRIDGERRFYERQGMTIPGIYFNGEVKMSAGRRTGIGFSWTILTMRAAE